MGLADKYLLSPKGSKDLKKGIISSVFASISLMLPIIAVVMMIDEVVKKLLDSSAAIPGLWKYVVLVIAVLAVIFAAHWIQYGYVYISTYEESASKRVRLAEKLRTFSLSFFNKRDLTELTSTIMKDCTELENTFSHAIPQLYGSVASIFIMAAGLLLMDYRMAIAILWVIPVDAILVLVSRRKQKKDYGKKVDNERIIADGVQECLENIRELKAYNYCGKYLENINKKFSDFEKSECGSELSTGIIITAVQMILKLGLVSAVVIGARLFISEEIDFITYLIFLIVGSRIYDPITSVFVHISAIFRADIQTDRMRKVMEEPVQTGRENVSLKNYDIEFKNVVFSYGDEKVLKGVSFTARQGKVTALIGPSGSGKSTVTKLIARFWDAGQGEIFVGGEEIGTIAPETLLKYISVVFQDVVLFNDTILENIRLGRKDATDEEVYQAAKEAQCEEFINIMPEKYNTQIGENGVRLSGGQRQRISIARAILKNAPIILLDEATAFLDVENETRLQEALSYLIKNKTVIIVAHRLRTIANANKIVVLEDGKVAEQGTAQELLLKDGVYKRMLAF